MTSDRDMGLRTVFVNQRAASQQLRKIKLVVTEGPDAGREFVIERAKVYLGRAAVNDIVLTDRSISGTHLELRAEEQGMVLRDLSSTNGTYLAGCRVRELVLAPDVPIRLGPHTTLKLLPTDGVVELPLSEQERFGGVIGRSVIMRQLFATLSRIGPSDLPCLIEGDTGTGKERIARAIHDASRRKSKPYVVLDCSSIPRDLMESYVFGHERGAFTGAHGQHKGAFEQASGGTLFLDEVGELDISLQPKLLRVLENREFKRVGGQDLVRADCRVLAATNRDLRAMVHEGTFREDLYFRLSVVQLGLPALRERREDIPLLVEHFLQDAWRERADEPLPRLTADALDALMTYAWPGNVRELKNVIQRAASLTPGPTIDRPDLLLRASSPPAPLPLATAAAPQPPPPQPAAMDLSREFKELKQEVIERFEIAYLEALIASHEGNISRAAKASGITRYHLRELLKKYDLRDVEDA
jgi:DNA-binding NtrC family response regulator